MNWQDIKRSNLKDINDAKRDAAVYKVYGWRGKNWPRLLLTIYREGDDEFLLSCKTKKNTTGWWEIVSVPNELRMDIVHLLMSYQPKR